MIINFSVQNFGSIKDKQTLSFEADKSTHLEDIYVIKTETGHRLLKLGLIYGANASGKTTVLHVLHFLITIVLFPKEKKTDELDFNPFLFDENTPNSNSYISIEFIQNGIRYYYEIVFFKKAIVNESLIKYDPKKTIIFNRKSDIKNQFTEIKFGDKLKIDKTFKKTLESNTLWNNTVFGGFLKTNIDLGELKEVIDWFANLPYSIEHQLLFNNQDYFQYLKDAVEDKDSKNFMLSILQKADFNISNLYNVPLEKNLQLINHTKKIDKKILEEHYHIEFEHKVGNKKFTLPSELQSNGTLRVLDLSFYLWLLVSTPQYSLLLIDELELALHPDLYLHILTTFLMNSNNSQILATTHNREILNNKDIFRDDAIWITDKNNPDCATELYSLADFDSSVIRDTTNRLNAYKSGKLGGVPNLGDYYIDL